jgi:hypothetical protein
MLGASAATCAKKHVTAATKLQQSKSSDMPARQQSCNRAATELQQLARHACTPTELQQSCNSFHACTPTRLSCNRAGKSCNRAVTQQVFLHAYTPLTRPSCNRACNRCNTGATQVQHRAVKELQQLFRTCLERHTY